MSGEPIDLAAWLDAVLLRRETDAGSGESWEAHFTVHGDPYVVPADQPWPSSQIAAVSTAPDDYGRANNIHIARHDPAFVLDRIKWDREAVQLHAQEHSCPLATGNTLATIPSLDKRPDPGGRRG